MPEVWASGDAYEPFAGRWSLLAAVEFLGWLGVPAARRWLDVGCGTGALTGPIRAHGDPAGVTGVDPSADALSPLASGTTHLPAREPAHGGR